eukprot:3167717-Amphidinium_carterae.1
MGCKSIATASFVGSATQISIIESSSAMLGTWRDARGYQWPLGDGLPRGASDSCRDCWLEGCRWT